MPFLAVRSLSFRPRASQNTIPVGPPPSLICTSTKTVISETAIGPAAPQERRPSRRRSIFQFGRIQLRLSLTHSVLAQPAAPRVTREAHVGDAVAELSTRGRSRSDPERTKTRAVASPEDNSEELPPPQPAHICSRARSLPNICPSEYLPCLSKADEPSSPTSSRGSRSRSRGTSPATVRTKASELRAEEPELEEDVESADPVLPRSARPQPVSVTVDTMGGLEEVAALVRGLDSPMSPSIAPRIRTPSPEARQAHWISEVEALSPLPPLSPLSPLWYNPDAHLRTLSPSAEGEDGAFALALQNGSNGVECTGLSTVAAALPVVEEQNIKGSSEPWDLTFTAAPTHEDWGSESLWARACTEASCWGTDVCLSAAAERLHEANATVDNSPQARRRRRQPLIITNSDQREQLDIVLNLISQCSERAIDNINDDTGDTGVDSSRIPAAAAAVGQTLKTAPLPLTPCRRRRRRGTLVVSNPDEEDPRPSQFSYSGAVGMCSEIPEAQACS